MPAGLLLLRHETLSSDEPLVTAGAAVQVSGANAPLAHLHMLQQLHGLPEVRAFPHLFTAKLCVCQPCTETPVRDLWLTLPFAPWS